MYGKEQQKYCRISQSELCFCRVEKELFIFIVPLFDCLGLKIEYLFDLLYGAKSRRQFLNYIEKLEDSCKEKTY